MTPLSPTASVVISTFNDRHYVDRCVETLIEVRHPSMEIVFVNDGSTDDTAERLREWQARGARIRVIDLPENLGVPGARNAGVRASTGDIVIFTDADCLFSPNWLEQLLASFDEPTVGCVGGPDRAPPDDPFVAQCIDYTITSAIATGGLRRGLTPLARYSPGGCNMAVRRSVLEEVGLFDERLTRRGEEKELDQRIRRAGHKLVYAPGAMLLHHRRPSLRAFWRQTFATGGARYDILSVAPDAAEPAHIFPSLLALGLGTCVVLAIAAPAALWPKMILASYALALVANGVLGALVLKSARAALVVPVTTAMVHLGYGVGFIERLLTAPFRRRVPQRVP